MKRILIVLAIFGSVSCVRAAHDGSSSFMSEETANWLKKHAAMFTVSVGCGVGSEISNRAVVNNAEWRQQRYEEAQRDAVKIEGNPILAGDRVAGSAMAYAQTPTTGQPGMVTQSSSSESRFTGTEVAGTMETGDKMLATKRWERDQYAPDTVFTVLFRQNVTQSAWLAGNYAACSIVKRMCMDEKEYRKWLAYRREYPRYYPLPGLSVGEMATSFLGHCIGKSLMNQQWTIAFGFGYGEKGWVLPWKPVAAAAASVVAAAPVAAAAGVVFTPGVSVPLPLVPAQLAAPAGGAPASPAATAPASGAGSAAPVVPATATVPVSLSSSPVSTAPTGGAPVSSAAAVAAAAASSSSASVSK